VLSLAYGADYFNVRTYNDSFLVPFNKITVISLVFHVINNTKDFAWMFICISVSYPTVGNANFQLTVITEDTVLRAILQPNNFQKPFYNGILYNGVLMNAQYNIFSCDCYFSNYNWYHGNFYNDPEAIMNLKRKDLRKKKKRKKST